MMMHLRYLRAVVRHKWFVLLAGRGTVPLWRLLIHDWTKFTPAEWGPYARAFYGPKQGRGTRRVAGGSGKPSGNVAFDRAWLHHLRWNDHHWQAWLRSRGHAQETRPIDRGIMFEDSGRVFSLVTGEPVEAYQLGKIYALPMPSPYREEMLADWRGANRAYGDQPLADWYRKTERARILHPETRAWVERELGLA